MNTQTTQSFSWLKKIPGDLYNLDEKPLLGFPPAFPWDQFPDEIARALQLAAVAITPGTIEWKTHEELFSGFGDHVKGLSVVIPPLAGTLWWVMPEQEMIHMMRTLIFKDSEISSDHAFDEELSTAFMQFIAIEAMMAFEKTGYDKKLNPIIARASDTPTEPSLCIDIAIAIQQREFHSRLFLSTTFRKSWMQYHLQQQQKLALQSPVADALDIIIHLEAGRIDIKPSEWQRLNVGDFVLIDSCSLDPDKDNGRVMLVINNTPFFRGKIKQGSLKILEHPLHHEVEKSMAAAQKNTENNAPNDEEFDDIDMSEDEELIEDDFDVDDTADSTASDTDFDFSDDDLIEKELKKNPLPAKDTPSKGSVQPSHTPIPSKTHHSTAATTSTAATPLSIDEIPLSIVIEVGRIKMSVKELLELQPGNMLELDIHPESGVDMVVNGKRMARGELLRIGDALGLRIIELA